MRSINVKVAPIIGRGTEPGLIREGLDGFFLLSPDGFYHFGIHFEDIADASIRRLHADKDAADQARIRQSIIDWLRDEFMSIHQASEV